MLTTTKRAQLRAATLPCLLNQVGAPPFEIVFALGDGEALTTAEAADVAHSGIPYTAIRGSWEHLTEKQNAAVKVATGEWITFWDDDDWSTDNRLATVADVITKDLSFVGPASITYHELVEKTRHTAKFVTGAKIVDKTALIRRAIWDKEPFKLHARPYGGADPGNVNDWMVGWIDKGHEHKNVEFPYVAMMHKTNTSTIKRFRVDPNNNKVLDGPKEYTLLGARPAVEAIIGASALARYEAAVK